MPLLSPSLTLYELCGPGYVFNSRVPDNAAEWLPQDFLTADHRTGNQLTIAGPMPVLCNAGVATPAGLKYLGDLGFNIEAVPITYQSTAERISRMQFLAAEGLVFIDQHVQTDTLLHPGRTWVEPATLSYLNNKLNLGRIVPAEYCPRRQACALSSLTEPASHQIPFPLLVKAATDKSCGGGRGVQLCQDENDLHRARDYFRSCDEVVVEACLTMHRNLCLNYAVYRDGMTRYLGAAPQIINQEMVYKGNWLEPDPKAPALLIETGHQIMARAWQLGYRGFAGFDATVMEDDSFFVYDLNFRFNGSTSPLVLYDALSRLTGLPVAKYCTRRFRGSYSQMLQLLYHAVETLGLIAICTYDPDAGGTSGMPPRISSILFGNSRDEVTGKESELSSLGFC